MRNQRLFLRIFPRPSGRVDDSATGYYRSVTDLYLLYSGGAGWHYGMAGDGVRTRAEALTRENEILVEGLEITPESRILDVGCGDGAFAAWCAEKFGCRVTGITPVPEHAFIARALAEKRTVDHLCRFLAGDMNRLPFVDGSFDFVFNQESVCYARDKTQYLAEVRRLLKPGGAWSAVAFGIREEPLTPAEAVQYGKVLDGFRIPGLLAPSRLEAALEDAGYAEIKRGDLTPLSRKTAQYIVRVSRFPLWQFKLGIAPLFFRVSAVRRRHIHGHFSAGAAFSRGLLEGYCKLTFHRGWKPR
ncbi:MAG: class I SAM-dependent methyltransferase [Candidatus Erginobacter occultus]|nr:class I SAM-dependent methyltransferase [Candidatus Erginobacter occultus]